VASSFLAKVISATIPQFYYTIIVYLENQPDDFEVIEGVPSDQIKYNTLDEAVVLDL
jgi:hypothetical protein